MTMETTLPVHCANTLAGATDALVGWLLCDITRARRILGTHYDIGDGSCYHQGATCERFKWPCEISLCARRAVIIHAQKENRDRGK